MRNDVNLITGLKDWSRDTSRIIPRNVKAANNMDGVSSSEMGLYIDDRGYYHTSGTVGVGWLRDYQNKIIIDSRTHLKQALMIRPRYELNPWDMLIKVMNDPEYELYTNGDNSRFFEIYTNEPLIPVPSQGRGGELLAALSFVKECERICKKRLRQEMSFEESNFNGRVVGNLQVSKHIKANVSQAREDRIYCRYPIFSVDTLENRIMKAALQKSHRIFRDNGIRIKDIGRLYSYCENSLKAVKLTTITKADFNRVNLTGFNSYYKSVIELAKTVLIKNGVNDLSVEVGENVKYVIPYSIKMESLFEFYVRSMLKESIKNTPGISLKLDEYRAPQKNPLITLKETDGRAYLMQHYVPDIAIMDTSSQEPRYLAVFDVKYQNSMNGVYANTRRHNSHQLIFYTLLLNVSKCGFIFPCREGVDQSDRLHIYELNIHDGNAMDESERYYSQWTVELQTSDNNGFADRMLRYVQGIQESIG